MTKKTNAGDVEILNSQKQKQATSRAAFLGTGLPAAAPRSARRSNLAQVRHWREAELVFENGLALLMSKNVGVFPSSSS